jgi:mannose-6-phosphate isomerase
VRRADAALGDVVGWALSDEGRESAPAIVAAARAAASEEFADELALVAELDDAYPADPGIVVALLMNLVTLQRGQGLFIPAGVLHAYLEGLGVEIMAASDNVLRGGLTPKHIDAAELLSVLDAAPGPAPVVRADTVGTGLRRFRVPVPDFALLQAAPTAAAPVEVPIDGVAIALATTGEVTVSGAVSTTPIALRRGEAVLVTPDEALLRIRGAGEVFVAVPGR